MAVQEIPSAKPNFLTITRWALLMLLGIISEFGALLVLVDYFPTCLLKWLYPYDTYHSLKKQEQLDHMLRPPEPPPRQIKRMRNTTDLTTPGGGNSMPNYPTLYATRRGIYETSVKFESVV